MHLSVGRRVPPPFINKERWHFLPRLDHRTLRAGARVGSPNLLVMRRLATSIIDLDGELLGHIASAVIAAERAMWPGATMSAVRTIALLCRTINISLKLVRPVLDVGQRCSLARARKIEHGGTWRVGACDIRPRVNVGLCLHTLDDCAGLTTLHSLRIHDCGRLHCLRGLENCQRMQELALGSLTMFPKSKMLQYDDRSRLLPSTAHLESLSLLARLPSLFVLNLYHCEGLYDLEDLRGCGELRVLSLHECDCLQALTGIEDLKQLWSLRVSSCPLGDVDELPSCDSLAYLDLSHLSFSYDLPGGVDALRHISQCHQLESLKLHNVDGLVGDCFDLFAPLESLFELRVTHCFGAAADGSLPLTSVDMALQHVNVKSSLGICKSR